MLKSMVPARIAYESPLRSLKTVSNPSLGSGHSRQLRYTRGAFAM